MHSSTIARRLPRIRGFHVLVALACHKPTNNLRCYGRGVFSYVSFPNANHAPAKLAEFPVMSSIASAIALDLSEPVPRVRSASQALTAFVPMPAVPEVAVAKNDRALRD